MPHYSDWYEAKDAQDLANQLEFKEEAEGDDEVLDEQNAVIGTIGEDLCLPMLITSDGKRYVGPELARAGDTSKLTPAQYAEKLARGTFRKE